MASPNPWVYDKVILPHLGSEGVMSLTFLTDVPSWTLHEWAPGIKAPQFKADSAIYPRLILPSAGELSPLSLSGLICQMERNMVPSSKNWEN